MSLTVPLTGATVSGSAVTLTATASDNVAAANVQFKVDGSNVGSAITSSPYTTTWNSTGVSDGSHTLYAVAEDTSGNYATSSITVTVRNSPAMISSIATSTPTATSATITWTTDEAATSQINYGTTTAYGTASSSAALVTSHSITLTGLTVDTTYHFQVVSVDSQSNTATSSDQTFMPIYAMNNWDAAKTAVAGGSRNATLEFVGSSITAGAFAVGTGSNLWNGAQPLTFGVQACSNIPNASIQTLMGDNGLDLTPPLQAWDTRFTASTNWIEGGQGGTIGYSALTNVTNTNPLSFVPAIAFNSIDVYYTSNSGLGSATINVDGGSSLGTINSNQAAALRKSTFSTTLGTHTLNFVTASGEPLISGFVTYNSAIKQISCFITGWSGGTMANFSDTTNAYAELNALVATGPDLVVLEVGANDWVNDTSTSTVQIELQKFITALQPTSDVIIIISPPSASSAAPLSQQAAMVSTITSVAASNGVNVVYLPVLWGSYTQANANGWMSNIIHPDAAGYAQIAAAVLPYLLR